MTDGFRNFKNTVTGEVVYLPAHYADLFDTLEPTEEDVECTTCNLPEPVEDEPAEEPGATTMEVVITEPAKRTRRRSNSDEA